jgi:CheY-like chemotaxis protein
MHSSCYARFVPIREGMLITAYGDQQTHEEALASGAEDLLTQPIDFAQLRAKLSEWTIHKFYPAIDVTGATACGARQQTGKACPLIF